MHRTAESEAMDPSSADCSVEFSGVTSNLEQQSASTAKESAAEEKRSRKLSQKSQRQGQDTPPKRPNERNALLQEQQLDIAQKKTVESQLREVDLRQSLKSAGKEYHKELKAMKQRHDLEKNDLTQQVCLTRFRPHRLQTLYLSFRQVRALSDALDRANESAAEWKEAHASQKDLLTGQIAQLNSECKAKHQAFVALQLKYDELEASAGHQAAAERKNAAREIEQLRATIETHNSEKIKLQNALTVSLEDYQRLHQQLATVRKALKDSEEKLEARDCHLELVEREMEMLRDQVRRKEHLEEELGHALAEQIRINDEKDGEIRSSNAQLTGALEQVKVEVDAFSFAFSQSKSMLEDTVASVEHGVESQKKEIESLREALQESERLLQEKDAFWQEQIWSKTKGLEDSHAQKLEACRQISAREQENAKRLFQQQQTVFTDRIAFLEKSVQELQAKLDAERQERESLTKEYEDALDELDANHKHVKLFYKKIVFIRCSIRKC